MIYEVGKCIKNYRGHQEGLLFDIDDSGANLIAIFNHPTQYEIEQFKSGHSFEIRYTELYEILMITTKIGNLNWMDAPYSPHLSKNLTQIQELSSTEGLSLTLVLIDGITGEVKSLRLLGLSNNFTQKLLKAIDEQKEKPFEKNKYHETIEQIYTQYNTEEIVRISNNYCKIG